MKRCVSGVIGWVSEGSIEIGVGIYFVKEEGWWVIGGVKGSQ
jgi:hypothetical protein